MLDTGAFVSKLIQQSYTHLCVVPCSFAKNIINEVINNDGVEYIPCASEAVACSMAAGLKMAGKKPLVIVQSSGLTNMGSCITSLLKPYDIKFPMLVSWRAYNEGDSEIQHKHLATKLPDLIDAYGYRQSILNKESVSIAIDQIEECHDIDQICILEKGTFSNVELSKENKLDLSNYKARSEFLKVLNTNFRDKDVLFIGTTGNTAREMYSFMPDTDNFYLAGNMGGALSLGLGAAKAGKKVIVCGGDAEFVMHMGGLTSVGRYTDQINLTYIVFDNESNKSTGGQNTYQKHIDYIGIAKSSNITNTFVANDLDLFSNVLSKINDGVNFIYTKCSYDNETPRPPMKVVSRNVF
ncbi:thiamine pyrophosphate-binding protein [bacterium]|jgi:sulfopyruvate decarboxylase TPP-binding subunit|nr:thiamine pyrophosphate-binding protein [bacterium]